LAYLKPRKQVKSSAEGVKNFLSSLPSISSHRGNPEEGQGRYIEKGDKRSVRKVYPKNSFYNKLQEIEAKKKD
jgi:hypothetical protein